MSKFKSINNERFPEPIGAYSNGLQIPLGEKTMIVLTGQIALLPDGTVAYPEDPAKQTEFVFENIKILLDEANATLMDIIRVVIYVTDMNDFKNISPIRNKYLKDAKPVSTLVEVNKLTVPGCKIEIEVTAIK